MQTLAYDYRKGMAIQVHGSTTNVLYILGTAGDGTVLEPIRVSTQAEMLSAFGDKGSIPKAFSIIMQSDPSCEIYACKVTGLHSKCQLSFNMIGGEVIEDAIEFTAAGSSHLYDQVEIELTDEFIEIRAPLELGGSINRYMFIDYPIIGLLMRRINYDTEMGVGIVYMNTDIHPHKEVFGALYSVNPSIQRLKGGYDGVDCSKEELYFGFESAYDILSSLNISVIVPLEGYMDDVHPRYLVDDGDFNASIIWNSNRKYLDYLDDNGPISFHRQLIDFCASQLSFGVPTIGIMGMNPFSNFAAHTAENEYYLKDYISSSPVGQSLGFALFDSQDPSGEDGRYISIICGDILYNDGIIENGYLTFATKLASSYSNLSLTNTSIEPLKLYTEFTTDDLGYLDSMGLTSFRLSPLSGLVISNAVSVTNDKSEYHYLCNTRMIQLFLAKINEALQTLIGERIDLMEKDSIIESKIDDIIVLTKEAGIIKSVSYNVIYDKENGTARIEFDLKALYMVESIKAYKGG